MESLCNVTIEHKAQNLYSIIRDEHDTIKVCIMTARGIPTNDDALWTWNPSCMLDTNTYLFYPCASNNA